MRFKIALWVLMLSTCVPLTAQVALTTHRVATGDHDYLPGHATPFSRDVAGFEFTFCLPATAWFDPTAKGPIQRDGKDWNKAGGISYYSYWRPSSYPKNRRSALVATRPGRKAGTFQVCAYTNDASGGWRTGEALTFAAGDTVRVRATVDDGRVTYRIRTPGAEQTTVHPLATLSRAVAVGPWFGGNRTSPLARSIATDLRLLR